jgi:hypothetical protein
MLTLMLNLSEGTSRVKSVGLARSCHKRDGDVTPPAKRQLVPTTAIGSEMGFLYVMTQTNAQAEPAQTTQNSGEVCKIGGMTTRSIDDSG